MRILGIDPGYAIVGYGVIDYFTNNTFHVAAYGAITTEPDTPFEKRLMTIYDGLNTVINRTRPEVLAVEKLYFVNNVTTGIGVGEARGVTLLAAAQAGLPIYEYSPMAIKQAVTGYGKAEKKQVMELTRMILGLEKIPKPDDTADALAVAICHAHSSASTLGELYSKYNRGIK
ncbi:MAG: crossover junction endodeoxyribonuclease RuvC [Oscillospiraceae bacterium]|nr:crossover junction endodeoxyribonuclease RuvC [Oscillospiraceae bacterium]MBR5071107.1 crossover junction endodeoxyribonuclease RuvC [Oscillospiraceae bacterium]